MGKSQKTGCRLFGYDLNITEFLILAELQIAGITNSNDAKFQTGH